MEAALAAAAEDAGSMAAGEDRWDASSQVSGASAVSGMSVYTAAHTGAPASASAGASAYAPSTVGGRRPARQRKQKARHHLISPHLPQPHESAQVVQCKMQ